MSMTSDSLGDADSAAGGNAMTAVRDLVKLGGVALAANGYSSSQIQMWSGVVITIAGIAWSQYVSWVKHRQLAVAHTAVAQLSRGNQIEATAALNRAQLTVARR